MVTVAKQPNQLTLGLMMKKIFFLIIVLSPLILHAQWAEDYYQPRSMPRVYAGADAAAFRISLHNFNDVYTSKWGESYGAFLGVRAFGAHYIAARYGVFQKSGKEGLQPSTGADLRNASWQEQWLKIGLRIHPEPANKWGSYYGFGVGFFKINEAEPISVFNARAPQKKSNDGIGSGFYLEFGIDYFVINTIAAFIDIEISSGGTESRTSFEAMSVGGWRFSAGLAFWPF